MGDLGVEIKSRLIRIFVLCCFLLSPVSTIANAETKTLDCPSDKVHAADVRLLYQQRTLDGGEVKFFFKPLNPVVEGQTWEQMRCNKNIKKDGMRITQKNHSQKDIYLCEIKMYNETFFGLKREQFSHFFIKYDFKEGVQEMLHITKGSTEIVQCNMTIN